MLIRALIALKGFQLMVLRFMVNKTLKSLLSTFIGPYHHSSFPKRLLFLSP
ncbi:hypothetical protein LINPERPRIM_LOCUS4099 [Linum perenne]